MSINWEGYRIFFYYVAGSASGQDGSYPALCHWWSCLARSGSRLPVARSNDVESLVHEQCQRFLLFSVNVTVKRFEWCSALLTFVNNKIFSKFRRLLLQSIGSIFRLMFAHVFNMYCYCYCYVSDWLEAENFVKKCLPFTPQRVGLKMASLRLLNFSAFTKI